MEQGTYTNPNPLALVRAAFMLLFKPTGATSADDLGVIESATLDYGMETEKVQFAISSGAVIQGINENISIAPVIKLKGRQYTDAAEAYLQCGTIGTDV